MSVSPNKQLSCSNKDQQLPYQSPSIIPDIETQNSCINLSVKGLEILLEERKALINEVAVLKQRMSDTKIEKEEVIDQLTKQNEHFRAQEDDRELLRKDLSSYLTQIEELTQERNQVTNKCEKLREFYLQELYSKQSTIEKLTLRVDKLRAQIDDYDKESRKLRGELITCETIINAKNQQIQKVNSQLKILQLQHKSMIDDSEKLVEKTLDETLPHDSVLPHHTSHIQNCQVVSLKSHYEAQLSQLSKFYEYQLDIMRSMHTDEGTDLKRTMETLVDDDTLSVYDVMSMKSFATGRGKDSLRSQLKDIKVLGKNDEECSQYTSKYFQYDHKFQQAQNQVLTSLHNIHIQEELILEEDQDEEEEVEVEPEQIKTNSIHKKQLFLTIGAGLLGFFTGLGVMKKYGI